MANGLLSVFNIDVEKVDLDVSSKRESDLYYPKADSKEPYEALVRILPIPVLENDSIVGWEEQPFYSKLRYWLKDNEGFGSYYDSPSVIGKECPIQKTFFKLYYSDNAADKLKAEEDFNPSTHYWSLVQVLKDEQNPDMEGKIKIYRYTNTIKKLIDLEKNPESVIGEDTPDKVAVWDFLAGKNLFLKIGQKKVVLKGRERIFPDYEGTKFVSKTSAFKFNLNDAEVVASEKTISEIVEFYNANVPSISNYKFKMWEADESAKVKSILSRYNSSIPQETHETQKTESIASVVADSKEEGEDEIDQILREAELGD